MNNNNTQKPETVLQNLFNAQNLAVLSTVMNDAPYCNLIAYYATDDLKHLVFATPRTTRKYANIEHLPRVSIFIDNRQNTEEDFHAGVAVNVSGRARELKDDEAESCRSEYQEKFPYLKSFIESPTTAIFKVDVDEYNIVTRFQEVMIYRVE